MLDELSQRCGARVVLVMVNEQETNRSLFPSILVDMLNELLRKVLQAHFVLFLHHGFYVHNIRCMMIYLFLVHPCLARLSKPTTVDKNNSMVLQLWHAVHHKRNKRSGVPRRLTVILGSEALLYVWARFERICCFFFVQVFSLLI